MKNLCLFFALITFQLTVDAQCDTTYVSSNYTQSADILMSGVFYIDGDFVLPSGITIYVNTYEFGGCGKLEIHAESIIINGTINGDYAGYPGGSGGDGAIAVTSLTGHINSLSDCQNKDDAGRVEVAGGNSGQDGNGDGAGNAGSNGSQGSGPKQQCLTGDESGMIGGGGGAGGGSGGSYGGAGSIGGNGGNGTNDYTATGLSVSAAYAVIGGNGGNGGGTSAVYGTATGFDIDLGSGGGGSGGGGRSFDAGSLGGNGGDGGGMVKLVASESFELSGTISVNGENGQSGGNGGSGGVSPKCCSDGCDDCGEATVSAGAGGGGGAGGGSGGGVFIECGGSIEISGDIFADGGNGGIGGTEGYGTGCTYDAGVFCGDDQSLVSMDGDPGNQGGAGGGGRIKIFYVNCNTANINPGNVGVDPGTGNGSAQAGSYETICGYVSSQENFSQQEITLFPNPSSEYIHLKTNFISEAVQINFYDMTGRLVFEVNNYYSNDPVDVSWFDNGTYFVKIVYGKNVVPKTFIKN